MKLANRLTLRISFIFLVILTIWSVIYFSFQMNQIYDDIDDGLENLKQEFILKSNENPGFIEDMEKHNPINMIIEKIDYREAIYIKETYTTEEIYFPTENDDEEVRMFTSAFLCEMNGQYYKLRFFTSNVEAEDLIRNMLYLLIALWLSLGTAMIIASKIIIRNANKPLYKLLNIIKTFKLGDSQPIYMPETSIKEFKELNTSVEGMLKNSTEIYNKQKEFIENASHEMQTPLAIINNKLELLINDSNLNEKQLEEISTILTTLNRMKRMNDNLLLLSKIKNKQFPLNEKLNLADTISNVLSDFEDLIAHKGLTVKCHTENSKLFVNMNADLAHILITNLIKNAILHNITNGTIDIYLRKKFITIKNTGNKMSTGSLDFERYITKNQVGSSNGIGLSIVKSIVEAYNFTINYQYKENYHCIFLHL